MLWIYSFVDFSVAYWVIGCLRIWTNLDCVTSDSLFCSKRARLGKAATHAERVSVFRGWDGPSPSLPLCSTTWKPLRKVHILCPRAWLLLWSRALTGALLPCSCQIHMPVAITASHGSECHIWIGHWANRSFFLPVLILLRSNFLGWPLILISWEGGKGLCFLPIRHNCINSQIIL